MTSIKVTSDVIRLFEELAAREVEVYIEVAHKIQIISQNLGNSANLLLLMLGDMIAIISDIKKNEEHEVYCEGIQSYGQLHSTIEPVRGGVITVFNFEAPPRVLQRHDKETIARAAAASVGLQQYTVRCF